MLVDLIRTYDEDITPSDTHNPPVAMQGPMTRAQARQLHHQVSSFLSVSMCDSKNGLLFNDVIILRNYGDDQQGHGDQQGCGEDHQGCPSQDGGPIQSESKSSSGRQHQFVLNRPYLPHPELD